ncbi:MAG: DUF4469 domain-containing protein [Treponematales bacterium]
MVTVSTCSSREPPGNNAAHSSSPASARCEAPNGTRVKAKALAVNEPKHLKAIAPATLVAGTAYRLVVVTQTAVKGGGNLLKNIREVKSEFTLTAQAEPQRAAV